MLGADIPSPESVEFNGLQVDLWPRIAWSPLWALTFSHIQVPPSGRSVSVPHMAWYRAWTQHQAC